MSKILDSIAELIFLAHYTGDFNKAEKRTRDTCYTYAKSIIMITSGNNPNNQRRNY